MPEGLPSEVVARGAAAAAAAAACVLRARDATNRPLRGWTVVGDQMALLHDSPTSYPCLISGNLRIVGHRRPDAAVVRSPHRATAHLSLPTLHWNKHFLSYFFLFILINFSLILYYFIFFFVSGNLLGSLNYSVPCGVVSEARTARAVRSVGRHFAKYRLSELPQSKTPLGTIGDWGIDRGATSVGSEIGNSWWNGCLIFGRFN